MFTTMTSRRGGGSGKKRTLKVELSDGIEVNDGVGQNRELVVAEVQPQKRGERGKLLGQVFKDISRQIQPDQCGEFTNVLEKETYGVGQRRRRR